MSTVLATDYFQAEQDLQKARERQEKAERMKDVGEPIELKGKVIKMIVRGDEAWTAESGSVARRVSLNTGRTVMLYKGHAGPVTCIEFYQARPDGPLLLITGSWDKTIRIWSAETGRTLVELSAHGDFLKSLVVLPGTKILVSGSADKAVKLWDLQHFDHLVSDAPKDHRIPVTQVAQVTEHRRPVDCLAGETVPDGDTGQSLIYLYTGDSMGVIKKWKMASDPSVPGAPRPELVAEYTSHTTGITAMLVENEIIWSGSSDKTVRIQGQNSEGVIEVNSVVRAVLPLSNTPIGRPLLLAAYGDKITLWDSSSFGEKSASHAEALAEIDVHAHDVTGLAVWVRQVPDANGSTKKEAWIASGSLDGTIRRWRFSDVLENKIQALVNEVRKERRKDGPALTEEEERELAELMDDDD